MQFIDEVKIYVKSGNGGNGAVSFRREKYIPYGGPNGGDGGNGGSIIFSANSNLNTLLYFHKKQHFIAENGENGKGKNCSGKFGSNLIIEVPIGTQILSKNDRSLIFDMNENKQEFQLLKGGVGGLGNTNFKSSTNQAPRKATLGKLGQEMDVILSLKILSDAGLIGMPNAGKSTLLTKITAAKAKIADYPFTTTKPILGMVKYYDAEFVLADIPGLIEGAHNGIGLGDRFLKHVERCRVLVHMIDVNSEDIAKNYLVIRNELSKYSIELEQKSEIICLNKIELIDEELLLKRISELKNITNNKIIPISAHLGTGLNKLIESLLQNF